MAHSTNHVVKPSVQETVTKNAYEPCSNNNKGPIYEERRLQIEELDEWRTQKLRIPDKPKPSQDELNTSPNQLKVGDKVLLDAADPRITTSEPNEEIPLTILSIFPYGTVEVNHPKFGTFKFIAGMRSINSLHHLDHAKESPYGQAQGCALGHMKTGQDFSPTRGAIRCHGCAIWPWAKLPEQHGRKTRPCLETVVETENVTLTCDTPVPSTCGRHCQNEHGHGPMYTGVGEANEARHGRATRPCAPIRPKNTGVVQMSDAPKFKICETHGHTSVCPKIYRNPSLFIIFLPKIPNPSRYNSTRPTPHARTMSPSRGKKTAVPASNKRKGAASSLGPTTEIRHPFLQVPLGPQEELYQILRARPLALLTTNPLRLFFEIVEPTYLEFTLELCSTFYLQTVMTNFDNPGMIQFCLDGLSMANGHVIDLAYFISLAIRHQTERHRRGVLSIGPYVTRLAQHFGLLNMAEQSSSLTLIGQMSLQGILSMLSMRMIEKRRGTYPSQYCLAQSTEEEDLEDITDSATTHSRPVHAAASYADISECLTRFEQQCFQCFDNIDATLPQICQHFHISSPPPPREPSSNEDV
ncbi:hypothetical protein GOBAR_AA13788 [Gossypium barbadense]|uniref:Uncharacterized protein n=1 Tax=Gossypium barbadense TaxID=3634 RepID=A0A2P5XU32_GOSBA|nr:hypothetical protein GOBAR_AA13788 [Gossypium barbadense]